MTEGPERGRPGQERVARNPKVETMLRNFIGDPNRRDALIEGGETPEAQDARDALRESLVGFRPPERVQLVQALIGEQIKPTISEASDEERQGARAILSHLGLKGPTRYAAVEAYADAVASLGEDIPTETLEALEQTASVLLSNYNPGSRVTPEEISLGRAAWEVAQRVDQVRGEPEATQDPVFQRRSTVARLSGLGFRTNLIGHVSGISNLDISSDLQLIRAGAVPEPREPEPEPELPITEARFGDFLSAAGVHPIRAIMLGSMEPGRFYGRVALQTTFRRLTGGQITEPPYSEAFSRYARLAERRGLLTSHETVEGHRVFSIPTEEAELAKAMAGHMARFEETHELSLPHYWGPARGGGIDSKEVTTPDGSVTQQIKDPPLVRYLLFKEILRHDAERPEGMQLSESDLAQALEIPPPSVSAHVQTLSDRGIITRRTVQGHDRTGTEITLDPDQRSALTELVGIVDRFRSGDEAFLQEGRDHLREISGDPERASELVQNFIARSEYYHAPPKGVTLATIKEIIDDNPDRELSAREINLILKQQYDIVHSRQITATRMRELREADEVAPSSRDINGTVDHLDQSEEPPNGPRQLAIPSSEVRVEVSPTEQDASGAFTLDAPVVEQTEPESRETFSTDEPTAVELVDGNGAHALFDPNRDTTQEQDRSEDRDRD
jgi:DNA-binding MarR family transcriptional regulator